MLYTVKQYVSAMGENDNWVIVNILPTKAIIEMSKHDFDDIPTLFPILKKKGVVRPNESIDDFIFYDFGDTLYCHASQTAKPLFEISPKV